MRKIRVSCFLKILVLVAFMCLFPLVVLAEAPLFQGITWGTDYDTVYSQMRKVTWNSSISENGTTVENDLLDGETTFLFKTHFCLSSNKPNISVAGHEIDSITLKFVYIKDDKGQIRQRRNESIFFEGIYFIDAKNESDMLNWSSELKRKITDLYGNSINSYTDWTSPFSPKKTYTIWKIDDICIVLKTHFYNLHVFDDDDCWIYLKYGWCGADPFLNEANDIQEEVAQNNYDGL